MEGWDEPLLPRMAVPSARDWDGWRGDANKAPCRCSMPRAGGWAGMGTRWWQAAPCARVSPVPQRQLPLCPRLPLTLALA